MQTKKLYFSQGKIELELFEGIVPIQISPIFFIQTLLSVSEFHRFSHFNEVGRGL